MTWRLSIPAAVLAVATSLVAGCDIQQPQQLSPPADTIPHREEAGLTGPACTPTGAHVAHASFGCATCHYVPGSLCFDPAGPAQAPGKPAPAFDVTTKTCSSVACHGMYEGVFEYTLWDWGCECMVSYSVPYGGNGGATPPWFTTGLGCSACHGNPPLIPGTANRYTWHAGTHGQPSSPTANQCATCHPAGLGNNLTGGTGINPAYAAQHGNGLLDVVPRWVSSCFNCH